MRCGLPECPTMTEKPEPIHSRLLINDTMSKMKMKDYADEKRHTKLNTLQHGDYVLVKQPKTNKLFTPFNLNP